MKIGLCLSGGANKGSWQMGVVTALLERGVEFSLIAGTSIGGVVGAQIAAPMTPDRRWWWWETLTWGKVSNMRFPPVLAGIWGDSFYSDVKMRKIFKAELPENIEDCEIPLVLTAADIMAAGDSRVLFKQGNLCDALCATTAIPAIFPPVRIGDQILIDGGIGNYIPLEQFDGFDYVYVLIAGYGVPPDPPKNAIEMIFRMVDIYQQEEIIREIKEYSDRAKPKIYPIFNNHPEILNSSLFEWDKGARWLELGFEDGSVATLPPGM